MEVIQERSARTYPARLDSDASRWLIPLPMTLVVEPQSGSVRMLVFRGGAMIVPETTHIGSAVEKRFRQLANQWVQETMHVSSIRKACMSRSYQQIIGIGPSAIPLLLRELQQDADHWFWALNAITGEDPAQLEDTFEGAAKAWLEWGKEKGYI